MSFLSQPISLIPLGVQRMVGPIQVNVVINENAVDRLTITKQPIQQGASISDHAFVEPNGFSHTILFSANLNLSLSKLYQQLLSLQSSLTPFNIITPKRTYFNMLMATLTQVTDAKTENCLSITASYENVIIVPIGTVTVSPSNQRNASTTQSTVPSGKKSIAVNLSQGVSGLVSGLK